MEHQPFFVRHLVRTTHLTNEYADLDGVRGLLCFRTRPNRLRGNDREVALMALVAAQQLGMEEQEIREWTTTICEDILGNPDVVDEIEGAIVVVPNADDAETLMAWFETLDTTAKSFERRPATV